jgi:hypothetical protein
MPGGIQRFSVGLSAINLILIAHILTTETKPLLASAASPVLRGRGLEILDERGRVRASIKVQAAETFKPTGREYPETVVLRLIDQNGRPEVKIMASVEGGGLSLVGDSDATQALLQADSGGSSLRLKNATGREQRIEP